MIKKIEKDFELWNKLKQEIDGKKERQFTHIKTKEIWYANIWRNIWFESNWKSDNFKRPVLVLKIIWALVFIVTLTTKWKANKFYYKLNQKYFNRDSFLTLSQIRSLDKKRFINKIWKLDTNEFIEIKENLKLLLF